VTVTSHISTTSGRLLGLLGTLRRSPHLRKTLESLDNVSLHSADFRETNRVGLIGDNKLSILEGLGSLLLVILIGKVKNSLDKGNESGVIVVNVILKVKLEVRCGSSEGSGSVGHCSFLLINV
jgi:hypothetical protein